MNRPRPVYVLPPLNQGDADLIQAALNRWLESDLASAGQEEALRLLLAKLRDAGWRYSWERSA